MVILVFVVDKVTVVFIFCGTLTLIIFGLNSIYSPASMLPSPSPVYVSLGKSSCTIKLSI